MKRVVVRAFGVPAEVIDLVDVPEPTPGPGEIVIQMAARPIDPADLLLITGRHLFRPALPAPVGIEGAGLVVARGSSVEQPRLGAAVAVPYGGTWAERIVLPATDAVPLPDGADLIQASMLCVNPLTARLLVEGLSAGDWIVHSAAASGVGQLITRFARRRGLHSIAVVRRADQEAQLLALGADAVLVDGSDLAARVAAASHGAPIRRSLDAVAGETGGRMFSLVADGGELVAYGLLGSDYLQLPAAGLVFRDVVVRGFSRLRALRTLGANAISALYDDVIDAFERGDLAVPVAATYPLDAVRDALVAVEQADRRGKIILVS